MHHLGGFFARPRPFLPGEFVTTDSGTGLVHMAPDHGEDDFELCKAHGIDPVFAVEGDGKYREDWLWLGGQGSVINNKFNAPDGPICSDLREPAACSPRQRRLPAQLSAFMAVQGQGHLPLHPAMVHRHGQVARREECADSASDVGRMRARLLDPLRSPTSCASSRCRPSPTPASSPKKARNRLGSMVEGRPDWVLSRQRAWGVPIALFVDRKTGKPLVDPEVNERIVAAIREQGVDAWDADNAAAFLGQTATPTITRWSPTSSTSGSTAAAPMSSRWKAATGPSSAGPPTSISKAATSIAAGSSRRCWKAAARAGARPTTPC